MAKTGKKQAETFAQVRTRIENFLAKKDLKFSFYDDEKLFDLTFEMETGSLLKLLIIPELAEKRLILLIPLFAKIDDTIPAERKTQIYQELLELNRKVWLAKLGLNSKSGEVNLSVEVPMPRTGLDLDILEDSLSTILAITHTEHKRIMKQIMDSPVESNSNA